MRLLKSFDVVCIISRLQTQELEGCKSGKCLTRQADFPFADFSGRV
jgi:hypothetical protein